MWKSFVCNAYTVFGGWNPKKYKQMHIFQGLLKVTGAQNAHIEHSTFSAIITLSFVPAYELCSC